VTNSRFKQLLYLICGLTDFSGFVVVFAVSRGMAEQHAEPWYLGVAGGGLSFSMAVASLLSGWLSHRFDSRAVIVAGTIMMGVSAAACASGDPASVWFLPRYWLLGAGLGCVYPTLIGWLNRGTLG
jgi:MFS family permease